MISHSTIFDLHMFMPRVINVSVRSRKSWKTHLTTVLADIKRKYVADNVLVVVKKVNTWSFITTVLWNWDSKNYSLIHDQQVGNIDRKLVPLICRILLCNAGYAVPMSLLVPTWYRVLQTAPAQPHGNPIWWPPKYIVSHQPNLIMSQPHPSTWATPNSKPAWA